jgi:hypothetical protein
MITQVDRKCINIVPSTRLKMDEAPVTEDDFGS